MWKQWLLCSDSSADGSRFVEQKSSIRHGLSRHHAHLFLLLLLPALTSSSIFLQVFMTDKWLQPFSGRTVSKFGAGDRMDPERAASTVTARMERGGSGPSLALG